MSNNYPLPAALELDTANVVNDVVEFNPTAQDTADEERNEGQHTPVATILIPQLVGSKIPRSVSECGAPPIVFRHARHFDMTMV